MIRLKEVMLGKGLLKFAGVLPLCLLAAAGSNAQQPAAEKSLSKLNATTMQASDSA